LPSFTVAQQHVDGYASGFLRGGAKAVIGRGPKGISDYITGSSLHIRRSFVWKSSSNYHNHLTSWASTRSPGFTTQIDPDLDGRHGWRLLLRLHGLGPEPGHRPGGLRPDDPLREPRPYFTTAGPTRVVDTRGNGVGPTGKIESGGTYTYPSPAMAAFLRAP